MIASQVYSNERPPPFPRGENSENKLPTFKNLLPQNHWANFSQTRHRTFLSDDNEMCFDKAACSLARGIIAT